MKRNETKKRVSRILKFVDILNDNGEYTGGGIQNKTDAVEEDFWVEIMDDPVLDPESSEWKPTGRLQIHIGSTKKALEELGTFLLALARYKTEKTSYTADFELKDQDGKPSIHLVLHEPVEKKHTHQKFAKIHNIATAYISKDGTQVEEVTLSPHKP